MPGDRPIVYGLFIRYISMLESLWFVIYVQGLMVSYVFYTLFSLFFTSHKKLVLAFISYVFLITFFTGASVNVSQLIPDIFTPVVIIATIIFLISDKLLPRQILMLFIISVIGIASHNSHLLLVLGLIVLYYLYSFISKSIELRKNALRHLLIFLPLLITSALLNNVISVTLGKGFSPPNGSHVFLMGHFLEIGLLDRYLDETCETKKYKICAYKENIPANFLWDFDNSPLYKTGGWEANKAEYNAIIIDMLTTPKYLKKLIIKSISNGFQQLFTFDTGDTPRLPDDQPANLAVKSIFKDEFRAYQASKQYGGRLDYTLLNNMQKYVSAISLFASLLFLLVPLPISNNIRNITVFIIGALILNAFICAGLSGVVARYQSRVIWLLPIPVLIAFFQSKFVSRHLNE